MCVAFNYGVELVTLKEQASSELITLKKIKIKHKNNGLHTNITHNNLTVVHAVGNGNENENDM